MVVILMGRSGSGKTTLRDALLARRPQDKLVVSSTSRKAKATDGEGEYEYVGSEGFADQRPFAWVTENHGHQYGTRRSDIAAAAANDAVAYLNISPPNLLLEIKDLVGKDVAILWVDSPGEAELERRLREEAKLPQEEVTRRIEEGREWEQQMRDLSGQFRIHRIRHDTVENRVMQALSCF